MTPMELAVDAAAREARARHLLARDYHGVRQDVRDRALQDLLDEWATLPEHVHEHWRAKVRPMLEVAAPYLQAEALLEHARTWGDTKDEYGRSVAFHVRLDARNLSGAAGA